MKRAISMRKEHNPKATAMQASDVVCVMLGLMLQPGPTIIEPFLFHNHTFFVKRDDQIDPLLSGNKYRKLYSLMQIPAQQYQCIFSYGGTQSNAMLSIAALCQNKGWQFHYTAKPVPAHIKADPNGNLNIALQLGMQLHEVSHQHYADAIAALSSDDDATHLVIPQGGADAMAQAGVEQLACEIQQWQHTEHIEQLYLVTPSGTGTTAFYLAKALSDAHVLTTACVGDKAYLIQQMHKLGKLPNHLHILESEKKYHFAKPYPEFLAIYQDLKHAGIVFDLVYGCPMWHTLLEHIDNIDGSILYIHSGGLLGNASMLARYKHKGMAIKDETKPDKQSPAFNLHIES